MSAYWLRFGWAFLVLTAGASLPISCSPTDSDGSNISSAGAGAGAGGGTAASGAANQGGLDIVNPGAGGNGGLPEGVRRPQTCDANGRCTCLNLAALGAIATYGAGNDNTAAFLDWLNTKSTAKVDIFKSRTTLTSEFLAGYDVIILQNLTGWDFSADEVSAFAAWVQGGGGVVSLIGYESNNANEVGPANALLSVSGMQYNTDDFPAEGCPQDLAMCPESSPCCYCWGNSVPITAWSPDHPVSANMQAVGAFRGRSVSPGAGWVFLTYLDRVLGATQAVGEGQVLIFGDEWITYTSQWLGTGLENGNPDQYNPCYDITAGHFKTGATVFQIAQFWYNSIEYVAPPTECDFAIDHPDVIMK